MPNLLTILTVRTASERLPGKALAVIKSKFEGKKESAPLVVWIVRRLRQMKRAAIVAATTNDTSDDELTKVLQKEGLEVIRGSRDDVVSRMEAVLRTGQYPKTTHIFRMLGDMPFLEWSLLEHAVQVMEQYRAEALVYHTSPDVWPVYGSREAPFSIDGWNRIVRRSTTREHPDVYFHLNRREFKILYHQALPNIYYRPYRLEIDAQPDLDMVRVLAAEVGMLAPLTEIIKFLDVHPDVARMNTDCQEKTGPLTLNTYSNRQRRDWLLDMIGKPVLNWDGKLIESPGHAATPIFCTCGQALGWGWRGRLHLPDGSIMDAGFPKCKSCGLLVREWRQAK